MENRDEANPTPVERVNHLANCGDPEVEWLVDQFKDVVRTLYKFNTCSHAYSGMVHHVGSHATKDIVSCPCKAKASEVVSKWMLALQG